MTTIFEGDFESGDFSAWTATEGSPTITSAQKHHGSYAMQAVLGSGSAVNCRASKNITSASTVYMRCYVKMEDLFTGSGLKGIGPRFHYSGGTAIAYALVDCPNNKWGIRNSANSTNYYETGTSTINPDQWYCLELYILVHNTAGELKLWVDGVEKVSQTAINTGTNNVSGISVNAYSQNAEGTERTIYFDCAIAADTYIDMETGNRLVFTAGASQSVTVGTVSNIITVQVQDTNGNPITTGATVNLSSSSGGGGFYSDSGGTQPITSRTIPSGQSSTSFYYKDTTTGTPTLTASSTGLTPATTQFTIYQSGQSITHNDIVDWSTATSAFLTSVTPSNLSGSGSIRNGWTIGGSQVTGDISGNSASINGTITHNKIVDWDTATASFVTSSSPVTFSGLTISGTVSASLGIVSVSGSFSASGAVSAVINTLDDGSGNATFHNIAAYNVIDSKENFYIPTSYANWISFMANDLATFPETTGKIRFSDITPGAGNYATELIGGLWNQNNGFPETAPFIMTRHHLVCRKDAFIKGQVVSMEGCLTLYGGYAGWISNHTQSPIVWLARSGEGAQYCNLEIRKTDWSFGNLKAGIIQGACLDNGAGSGKAFLIGDDCYLVDVNESNIIGIQGATNENVGGFKFGKGDGAYYHKLYVEGNYLKYYCNGGANPCGFMPADGMQNLGGSLTTGTPYAWRHIYGRWIHAYDQFGSNNSTIGSYDALDDLSIIKNTKSKRVKFENVERDVLDFSNMSFLQLDNESISINNAIGFLFGVCKSLALALEKIETESRILKTGSNP
ncbi:MAG: hypothetical protein ACQCN3_00270 [Candidatus Bathyarchaeia archaeon]